VPDPAGQDGGGERERERDDSRHTQFFRAVDVRVEARLIFRSDEAALDKRPDDVTGSAVDQRLGRDEQREGDEESNLRVEVLEEWLANPADRPSLDQGDDEKGQPRDPDADEEVAREPRTAQGVTTLAE
jgi:hypothetical protein